MALNFESYAQKGHEFINYVARELETKDLNFTGNITRCVLYALRNHLTVEESFQMMAQLPIAIKALYVDEWKFNKTVYRIRHVIDFLDEVKDEYRNFIPGRSLSENDTRKAVQAVFKTVAHYVSAGEIQDVLGVLPLELRNWLKESISV
jgi:uncharacterized protein (DUF2267 family)